MLNTSTTFSVNTSKNFSVNQKGLPTPVPYGTGPAGQAGFSSVLLLFIAAVGLLAFIILAQVVPFKDKLFEPLYPKPTSEAAPLIKSFPATLTLDPNPAVSGGTSVSANGFGYYPSSGAYINILTPRSLYIYTRATDSSGNLSFTFNTAEPGTYIVKIYQNKPKGGKLTKMSETPLDVVQLTP